MDLGGQMIRNPDTPAARRFNDTVRDANSFLRESQRRRVETQRFIDAMKRRPLSRPEARGLVRWEGDEE